jgi:hypothetical protein
MNSSAGTGNALKRVEKPLFNLLEQVFCFRHRIYPVTMAHHSPTRHPPLAMFAICPHMVK